MVQSAWSHKILILGCGSCWLCVCLWHLVHVGSFFGGSFPPAVFLRVSLSPTSCFLLCRCGQGVLKLLLPCVHVFEAFLLVLFSCLFLVISSLFVFPDKSWVELVCPPLPPSPSFVFICCCFFCWWVLSSRRYPGVQGFYLLFFIVGCRGKAKWFKRAGVYYMIFKVPGLRDEIGDSLHMYSVNCDTSPT